MAWIRLTGKLSYGWDRMRKDANGRMGKSDPNRYRKTKVLSVDGASSKVFMARDKATMGHVVIKEARLERNGELEREIDRYKELGGHPNILRLLGSYSDKKKRQCLVFPKMKCTLRDIMDANSKAGKTMSQEKVAVYAFQLLRGMNIMHAHHLAHRDMKPENLLMKNERLVIADLGSCTNEGDVTTIPKYVTTRYYRAPEIAWEKFPYDRKVDIWAGGAIIAEMLLGGRQIFQCENAAALFKKQCEVLGAPTPADMAELMPPNKPPPIDMPSSGTLEQALIEANVNEESRALINAMLSFSPNNRPEAIAAMSSSFFDGLRASPQQSWLFKDWTRAEVEPFSREVIGRVVPHHHWSTELVEHFESAGTSQQQQQGGGGD